MNPYWTEAAQLYLILHQSFFLEKSVRLKSYHQDLLRSVCFSRSFTFTVPQRRNDLLKPPKHLTSSEQHLFVHLSIIIGLNCIICLDHSNLIFLTYYWSYRVMTDIYIISCKYLLYPYTDLIDLHYKSFRISSF